MASTKFTAFERLLPCILTTIVPAMFLISASFGPNFESFLLQDLKFPSPKQYTPMLDNLTDAAIQTPRAQWTPPGAPTRHPASLSSSSPAPTSPMSLSGAASSTPTTTKYSLYVHATPGHLYPNTSLFFGREVPSHPCPRFSRGLVDAFRRLLSSTLLDPHAHNAWFVNVFESAIPIRSFAFTYHYLTTSTVSFVESFYPIARYQKWETRPEFNKRELRKGELWMTLRRDYAGLVVRDKEIYAASLAKCRHERMCTWDEEYVQTLLHLKDEHGIAKRTVMYVNWTQPHGGSPKVVASRVSVVKEVQERKWDMEWRDTIRPLRMGLWCVSIIEWRPRRVSF